ncbi:hypothetical protein HYO65_gp012 [Tenacibaculum phage PTm1]|uniref:Uncharacterized protein n=2 Tax=Shirahamavirus PTm1 TaxID=2846435 RepID=A0A5S9HXB5_9CAUD|nr:hypothetical protein HYO65_gp012 [Tenacibaculum phage PTm1]BBI90404.1 hypothetical protein [Tenacibaculum phage PTm1]BBI90713.1 hypothetical protein [Tenacibaculum phage PTm5]
MKYIGNIDLVKFGQLLNTVIHKLPNKADITTNNTSEAQIAYSTAEKRIMYFDGTKIREIATLQDISVKGNKIVVSETDPFPITTAQIVEGDGWFKSSSNTLQIRTNVGWKPVSSTVNIPSWTANTDYGVNSLVIHQTQIWRNESGTTNNDATWTPANWTRIGGVTLTKVTMSITPSILHGQTVSGVTRTNNVYRLNHNLGSSTVLIKITESNNTVMTDETIIDANNIDLTFNTPAQTSGKTYTITIASI